jgi:GNAT superfamily N-acetyltransferase
MIDKVARRQAAEAIRHFLAGRISNEEFVCRYPRSEDPIIRALDDTLWGFYDDFREHTLTGEFAVPAGLRRQVIRWVMFLYTDEEYRWPGIGAPGMRAYYQPSWLSRVIGFSKYVEQRTATFMAQGDYDVWPFLKRVDFDRARRKPVLLGGDI